MRADYADFLSGRRLGATPGATGRARFSVWAPAARRVELHLHGAREEFLDLSSGGDGLFSREVPDVPPGALYTYRLDGRREFPDPASRHQPRGVHGPSALPDPDFAWTDAPWRGIPLARLILYELHVGTFTPAGTFDAAIDRLDELAELGVTAIELMPIAQFPGERNWGYDGVFPFAAQASYGGEPALKRLVDACHARGLAVVLDVVYNHLGPEGNALAAFGPYFTDRYRTPWGLALNFDGPDSDPVRRFFIENALHWTVECHVDALRLDAVHAIFDCSACPFLRELADVVHAAAEHFGRRIHLIAESDLNDTRLVRSPRSFGFGLDAQWNDEYHHIIHALLTGERDGYYTDYDSLLQLARAWREGFIFTGQYHRHRRRRHGHPSADIDPPRFVVFIQNHDQVGNRMRGERLSALVDLESCKLAAALVLLSPFTPLLFMGEEYADPAPFLYFVSHGDPELIDAVRKGRAGEFSSFGWRAEPPDPQSEQTFARSRVTPALRRQGPHALLWAYYRELIRLRKALPAITDPERTGTEILPDLERDTLVVIRRTARHAVLLLFNLADAPRDLTLPPATGAWRPLLDSAAADWGGPGVARLHFPAPGDRAAITAARRSACLFELQAKDAP